MRPILVLPLTTVIELHFILYLKLPIRSKNCCDLKGRLVADMQARTVNIRHLIIYEFSVIRKIMLGWTDRRLRRGSGLKDKIFGGYLLRDFVQLPSVSDKPLYHSVTDNAASLMGYMAYMKFQDVVKLFVYKCVPSRDDNEFSD